ncbi:MAG TPA: hypothetical protein VIH57_25115 [Bacteroidales bacterium]|jgi:Response regulator containing CheY-like receiver, AAA-type ATPase, and DNA-binding domains
MKKREIDLLIIEDNEAFSLLLERELANYLNQRQIKEKFRINMLTFLSSDECLQAIRKSPPNKDTISFIDFYLGEAINGLHVLKLLHERQKNIQVVMMSKSPHVKDKIQNLTMDNLNLHFIVKDEYTPVMCKMLLETFLESL